MFQCYKFDFKNKVLFYLYLNIKIVNVIAIKFNIINRNKKHSEISMQIASLV